MGGAGARSQLWREKEQGGPIARQDEGGGAGFLWRVQVSSYYSQASKEMCNGMNKEQESQNNLETVNDIGQHENII